MPKTLKTFAISLKEKWFGYCVHLLINSRRYITYHSALERRSLNLLLWCVGVIMVRHQLLEPAYSYSNLRILAFKASHRFCHTFFDCVKETFHGSFISDRWEMFCALRNQSFDILPITSWNFVNLKFKLLHFKEISNFLLNFAPHRKLSKYPQVFVQMMSQAV